MGITTSDLVCIGIIWAVSAIVSTVLEVGFQMDNPHQPQLPFWANCLIGFLTPVAVVCLPVIVPVGFIIAFFVSIYRSVFQKKEAR